MSSAAINTSSGTSSAPLACMDPDGDDPMADEEDPDDRILNNLDKEVISINMDSETTVVRLFPRYVPVDISSIPTLLPEPIAAIITGLAGTSRLTFRLLSFFTEVILETGQLSTRMYMGYSRRFFITMISSARRVYIASEKLKQGNLLGAAGFTDEPIGETQGFLQVLDRYTNLGIYIIHHGHTLAELFAMSGFFIGSAATSGSTAAAQLTVGLFDDLFGSNESSRMLSAIISLVSKEVVGDERYKAKKHGGARIFAGLTRALTAFVCLQYKTWKITSERLKMRLIYDCTVLQEARGTVQQLEPPPDQCQLGFGTATPLDLSPLQLAATNTTIESAHSSGTLDGRQTARPLGGQDHISHVRLGNSDGRSLARAHSRGTSTSVSTNHAFFGPQTSQDLNIQDSNQCEPESAIDSSTRGRRTERPLEDKYEISDEYHETTVTTQTLERVRTTERRRSPIANAFPQPHHSRSPSKHLDLLTSPQIITSPPWRSIIRANTTSANNNDWIEIDQHLDDNDDRQLPSSPNGGTASPSSRHDAHDFQSTERIQLVLRTMTDRLLQRKRTVRRMPQEERSPPERGSELTSRTTQHFSGIDRSARQGEDSPARSLSPDPSRDLTSDGRPSSALTTTSPPRYKRRASSNASAEPRRVSPVKRAMHRARTVLRPLTSARQESRSTSPSMDETDSDPVSPHNTLVSPPASPKMSLKAPPPTPAATLRLGQRERPSVHDPPAVPVRHSEDRPSTNFTHSRPLPLEDRSSERETCQTLYHETSTQSCPTTETETPLRLFPHDTLTNNIHRFMRYSSAAYGQYFLRILGMGESDFLFPSTDKYHGNTWAFAQHINLPIDHILLSSYTDSSPIFGDQKAPPIVHYIAVDHAMKAVVLTCRGTLGISDVLIDLTCDYCSIDLESDDPEAEYFAHSGMYHAAMRMTARSSRVHEILITALKDNPTYGLVVTGHSLGGGVAALITLAWASPAQAFVTQYSHLKRATPFVTSIASGLPAGRPIHCYTYGIPAVASRDLANYSKGLITAVIHDNDVVPTLSLGILRDLKNVALTLSEEGWTAESIVTRVLGVNPFGFDSNLDLTHLNPLNYFRRMTSSSHQVVPTGADGASQEQRVSDWMLSLIKTMRADMDNDKLYPPGDVYIIKSEETFVTVDTNTNPQKREKKLVYQQGHRVKLFRCESVFDRFREPRFAKNMMADHTPVSYEKATQLLVKGMARKGL